MPIGWCHMVERVTPDLSAAVARLTPLFETCQQGDEIEMRLGQFANGRFVGGVDATASSNIIKALSQYANWSTQTAWAETTDYYLQDTRLSVAYDHTTYQIDRTACRKERGEHVHVDTGNGVHDVRISKRREVPVHIESEMPTVFLPTHVRIKQRRSFTYRSRTSGWPGDLWRYDITIVWSGSTKGEAEEWQRSDRPPVYEVELEYIGGPEYIEHVGAENVSRSMCLKCIDLIDYVDSFAVVEV